MDTVRCVGSRSRYNGFDSVIDYSRGNGTKNSHDIEVFKVDKAVKVVAYEPIAKGFTEAGWVIWFQCKNNIHRVYADKFDIVVLWDGVEVFSW